MTSTVTHVTPTPTAHGTRHLVLILVIGLGVGVVSQLIGPLKIPFGGTAITLFPMIWAIIIGLFISAQKFRPVPISLQHAMSGLMSAAVLFLLARLSFTIGPNLTLLEQMGPALALQEIGHLFGTLLLSLPVAILLGMGRAAVGAGFSVDREQGIAAVQHRYGVDSDEYRGVISMYIFGAVFGAVVISIVTSVYTAFHTFDPLALAMGAGVGSGAMMGASTGVIIDAHPEMHDQVIAVAGVANVITNALGLYVGLYISLPLADRIYKLMTRHSASRTNVSSAAPKPLPDVRVFIPDDDLSHAPVPQWVSFSFIGLVGVCTASIAARQFSWSIVLGLMVMIALILVSQACGRLTGRIHIPAIIWTMTLGGLVSSPWSPIASTIVPWVSSVDFMSLVTVILTCAGLSMGKDLPILRHVGWKIFPVGALSVIATFSFATILAEFTLRLW
jgi:hypothetical protein